MNREKITELMQKKQAYEQELEAIEQYNELKEILENYQGTMQDFFNEYSGDEINNKDMTLYYGQIKVKINKDLTLDKNYIAYDNEENPTEMEYKED